jgi:hypothetical protein
MNSLKYKGLMKSKTEAQFEQEHKENNLPNCNWFGIPGELPSNLEFLQLIVGQWVTPPIYTAAELAIADRLKDGSRASREPDNPYVRGRRQVRLIDKSTSSSERAFANS